MATPTTLPLHTLLPVGSALLIGTGAISIAKAIRLRSGVERSLVTLAVGILGINFYSQGIDALNVLSGTLQKEVEKLGNPQVIKDLVLQSLSLAAGESGPNVGRYQVNIPAIAEQLFRTGVWGVVSAVGDMLFVLAQSFIEIKRDVLASIVRFLFPLLWGLYPLFPNLGHSIVGYLVEMALWGPCLYLIQIVIGYVAPQYLYRPGSLGVPLIAIEIVATLLMLEVPGTVHRLLSGTLHPGGESTALGFIFLGSRAVKSLEMAKKAKMKARKK